MSQYQNAPKAAKVARGEQGGMDIDFVSARPWVPGMVDSPDEQHVVAFL